MPVAIDTQLDLLKASLNNLSRQRYGADDTPDVERRAAEAGDSAYFLARVRLLEAERDAALKHLLWLSPARPTPPGEALARIKALCHYWPDLYETLQAVLATHPLVARDVLALAIKKFRPDTETYSTEDVTGLLIAAWNGGRHGFDAVLRTRKSAQIKAAATPWGRGAQERVD